ncbi:hypothetical protein CUR178_03513 [Leishmania enriettii]|uniref:Calpain catalytic domain-containing protein n=1 Tax=Leishmania enriettii TaxID=5663 RepID=A0A836H1D9_LEIEN|nr:hypothetical protein CUR178_03513 [Leishmania enriettii]
MQLCYISTIDSNATYFEDAWAGESAGGNPTFVTWRKNPLYGITNRGTEAVTLSFMVKQEDQRHRRGPEDETTYKQCGMVLSQYSYSYPIPTFWVTGNNHKTIHKGLFLNSREVANTMTIPPNSLCYLVPSCMHPGEEAKFVLSVYRMAHEDYRNITIEKLTVPAMDWENPATGSVHLQMRTKDRLDFYVDEPTDVHILLRQAKPYVSPKTGGDVMAQDYMGMYLYDDTDRKVAGVHAATNFRETSIIHHLPRSGRYAISITCPRGKDDVPADVTIVTSFGSHIRRVKAPEDAAVLPDEGERVEESEGVHARVVRIDYDPFEEPPSDVREHLDSDEPFEDRGFMLGNRNVTSEPWVHIGDLYPEGKTKPLLPSELSRDQFRQGAVYECCCLTGFATLIENHPEVIRNCFVSKHPRKDGRYTFQFHRYGQWVRVEIDDRIPMVKGDTVFCRSPTHHWWPLLLEKAYAKFYTLYENLVGCSLAEVYHDFSGCLVINTPLDAPTAMSAGFDIMSPMYWMRLRDELRTTVVAAQCGDAAESLGLAPHQFYGVLDVLATSSPPRTLGEVIVQLHSPYEDRTYTGPLSDPADPRWGSREMRHYSAAQNTVFMPVDAFLCSFFTMSQAHLRGVIDPCWNFHSEWGDGTNGGNPSLLTWRENPLYVVRNTTSEAVEMMAMIRQPDKRHQLHVLPELNYVRCDLLLAQSMDNDTIPTYLVTHNNHQIVHRSIFLNYREVASKIRVPPQSLCYLVPTAMYHEKSIFLLSFWYRRPADTHALSIARLRVHVARDLPAVRHVAMVAEGKDRIDFLVDVPTDVHILLSQENRDVRSGGDVRTDNYVGMYLYDDANQQVARVPAASNLREIGLVAHLPAQGHYVLSITCPAARDEEVKCRVEIVCVEAARVRVTDAYESAPSCEDIERAFLGAQPEGVPLELLPLNDDEVLTGLEHELRVALKDPHKDRDDVAVLRERLMERVRKTARDIKESERDLFLNPMPLGVPCSDLPLDNDEQFHVLEVARLRERQGEPCDEEAIHKLNSALHARAEDLAREKLAADRHYLNPTYLQVAADELPLDEDRNFLLKEALRQEKLKSNSESASAIAATEEAINDRAVALAKKMIDEERARLYGKPDGVPVSLLHLDDDPVIRSLEEEREELLSALNTDPHAITAVEEQWKARATEIAKNFRETIRAEISEPEGVPLRCIPLDEDPAFVALEGEWRDLMQDPPRNAKALRDLEGRMNDRAHELALEQKWANRDKVLDAEPEGMPLRCIPLDEDPAFVALEGEWRDLMQDPLRNAKALRDLEGRMNDRAHELALEQKWANRDKVLDAEPEGVPLRCIPLDEDPAFVALEGEWRGLMQDPPQNAKVLRDLEGRMNDRAHELALEQKWANRDKVLDAEPEGVPLRCIPLDEDPAFVALEGEWRGLMQDPPQNAKALRDLEGRMNDRAHELALEQKWANRDKVLDAEPEGVPLRCIPLDEDPAFVALEGEWRGLMQDPPQNAKALRDLEGRMNDRAHELALEQKWANRDKVLDAEPEGVPLRCIPLDEDPAFVALEGEWRDLMQDPPRNAKALRDLEGRMNDRAHELALEQKWANRDKVLDAEPEGVPLRCIPLDEDPAFVALEGEWRGLMQDPPQNAKALRDLEGRMNDRAHELALEQKWANRDKVLDAEPEGVPLRCIPLDEDPAFVALEGEWRGLMQDPLRNAKALRDLEGRMNDRAHELALEQKWANRDKVVDAEPEGVPLRCIPLDEDPAFVALEGEWRGLMQDPPQNAKALRDLEGRMNDRAHELALEQKWANRDKVLDAEPEGVPLRCIPLDEDPAFVALEGEWRGLMQDPPQNAKALRDLEGRMNDRAHELALEQKWANRDKVLDAEPEGVPLRCIPLDEDPAFVALEGEWRGLMQDPPQNAKALRDLEGRMNDRAHELALEQKWANRDKVLDAEPEGVPLRCIPLDEDPAFVALEGEWRGLMQDPPRNAKALRDLEGRMNDRAHELALEQKWANRDKVLDAEPEGVPLRCIPLDEDPAFVALEGEWRGLMQDPPQNAKALRDLEGRMNDRAHELALEQKWANRDKVLDAEPEGVPLRCIPLDEDPAFVALEGEWRGLMQDPPRNAKALRDLEGRMNDRAHELALEQKWANRDKVLDAEPEGVPLRCIPLDEDPAFVALEGEWRGLMQDPPQNAKALRDLEGRMNDRAHELALEQKWANRDKVLDAEPEGVPLRCIPLDEDPAFVALEGEWRDLMQDPPRNAKALRDLEGRMNDRAHELALEQKWANRDKVLDAEPEGVPLRCIPLDEDPAFVALEGEWRGLMQDPPQNAKALRDLEGRMNDRAHELALEQKWANRDKVLDAEPEGVPLRCIPLDEDPTFVALEGEWRDLMQDPPRNAKALRDLEGRMNDRAHELALEQKWANRDKVLDAEPEGVPLRCIPLDEDPAFVALEGEWRDLMQDPPRNAKVLRDLEGRMNDRAHELALEQKWANRDKVLDAEPEGVPLRCIPLDEDPAFVALEGEWRDLMQDPLRNAKALRDLEGRMNDRAHELALEQKWANRDKVLDAEPEGVPLRCIPLDEDPAFVALEGECDPAANARRINDMEDMMHERATKLAKDMHTKERTYLDPEPEGVPLDLLPLNEDAVFSRWEDELRGLYRKPKRDVKAIKDLQKKLNDRAHEVAGGLKNDERELFLDPEPEGRLVESLPLSGDPQFHKLEAQYRELKKNLKANPQDIADREELMNDRAHEVAKDMNRKERPSFMNLLPKGVPLEELPLDTDEEFSNLEAQRARLMRQPAKNKKAIGDIEDALNLRAEELAQEKIQADRAFMEDAPQNIPLKYIPLDKDKEFGKMEAQRMMLRAQNQNARAPSDDRALRAVEEQMNEQLRAMAREVKMDARRDMEPNPLGIPLEDLYPSLDEDLHFHELEDMYRDAKNNPTMAKKASQLLAQMNERAKEIAQAVHDKERRPLNQHPNGIPLETLPLNDDPVFNALENEARALRNAPSSGKKSADKLADIVDRLNARAEELANAARKQYVEATPEGVPMELLRLGDDPSFLEAEEELRRLERNPVANRQGVRDLKDELNYMAHEKAKRLLQGDRAYLDQSPEGVDLCHVPLDSDPEFHELETRRAKLKSEDLRAHQKAITALEDQLNSRAHELAREVKEGEVRALEPDPHGIPYAVIVPHNDDQFNELAKHLRNLKTDPKRNAAAIKEMRDRMNDRGAELAETMLKQDRSYLEEQPAGVPLQYLPLDSDSQFNRMEVERAKLKARDPLKNTKKIRELEDQLNARAVQLAEAQKQEDLRGLDPKPEGISLAVIDPHSDANFAALVPQLRDLKADPRMRSEQLQQLLDAMNNRAHELAREMLRGDRAAYLEEAAKGVPLDLLPLDTDPQFHDMEVQRAVLKAQDLRRNAAKMKDVEDRLRERANELAEQQRARDLQNLDQVPEGLPMALVNPHDDPAFATMVKQHRQLAKDSKKNAEPLAKLEEKMNDRVHELAREMLERDNTFLDPAPQGVSLADLPLRTDVEFHRLEVERAKQKAQDPRRNAAKIRDMEAHMNNRVHELALEQLAEDLRGVDQAPRGLPVELLSPHADSEFAEAAKQIRKLKKSPAADPEALQAVLNQMNDRVRAMADEAMDRDYLDPEPEGVPLTDLPLSSDPEFHGMEVERARLKLKDAKRNARAIKGLEQRLNDHAHELAKRQLEDDLAGCDPTPQGIPLALLKPTEDPKIAGMISQLRALKKEPAKNGGAIQELEKQMNDRAYELADQLLERGRGYLESKPEGVALEYLSLDKDPEFTEMEVERAKLKAQDPRRNQRRIVDLEDKLNDRAAELAAAKKAEELEHFLPQYNGIETVAMRPHDDPEFGVLVDQLRKLQKTGQGTSSEAQKLLQDMDTRLEELAKEKVEGDLWFLDKEPEGIPLEEVATESDPTFQQLRQERANLKATDPRKNADKIKRLEDQMGDRAHDLAKEVKKSDFDGVDSNPLGIPLELLQPRDDPQVARVLQELRRTKASPRDAQKAQNLLNEVNNRIFELAQSALSGERPTYLDPNPEGVPLSDLPLDTDGIYSGLEVERAKLVLTNPMKNAKQIEDLEDRLNERAHELAQQILKDDLRNVDPTPQGIPIEAVKPHNNPDFHEWATRARELRKDPRRNADKLAAIKEQMNELVNRMAAEMLGSDRGYLDPEPEGVPVEVVPLHEDPEFHAMEVERAVLVAQDPVKNKQAIADLEERLNVCAHQLADAQKREDLRGLSSAPLGVPVSLLNPHEDQQFAAKLPELRALKKDGSQQSQSRLNDTLAVLDDILEELAADYLEEDRAQYLEPFPQGIPVTALPLYTDPEFRQLEAERLDLISRNPKANKDAIRDLEAALNERAHELAREHRKNDRDYLDPEPLGIPVDVLPLDTDRQFSDLEAKRATLKAKDPIKNAAAIHDLEDQLNDLAIQLAEEQITEDLRAVDPMPEDIPVRMLKPHEDPEFARMVNALRFLKATNPKKNAAAIKDLEDKLNDRAHELAKEALSGDRGYLVPEPKGVPLADLPLDDDLQFHQMEVERAKLKVQDLKKNAGRIKDLEDKLNDRAEELAEVQKKEDLRSLDGKPRGIPLESLNPHDDAEFASHLPELRRLDPKRNAEKIASLQEYMNERAHELARDLLKGDRGYLDPEPENVPIADVPIDADAEFRELEAQRAKLKEDPRRNADTIKDLEDRLNSRAHALAKALKEAARSFLNPAPEGVPVDYLPLNSDPQYSDAELKRALLKAQRRQDNRAEIESLERALNDRAAELARAQRQKDRAFLDPEPEGIPITDVPLDCDQNFLRLEDYLRKLKRDLRRNADAIADTQEKMNDRAHQLAKDEFAKQRHFMDQEPEGVPLERLPLDIDSEFKDVEVALHKAKKDPQADPKRVAALEKRMNDRAHELARAELARDRAFLDPEPEGVPLADLPLSDDPEFNNLAKLRQTLKNNRRSRDPEVRDLEDKMNDRVHTLAKDFLNKNRSYLNPEPQNVPVADIPLNRDPIFRDTENDLMRAKKDPRSNADKIAEMQDDLNSRANDLARDLLRKERAHQEQEPLGVPLEELPLNYDPILNPLERKRRDLKKAPKRNADALRNLELEIAARVEDIARDFLAKERAFLDQEPEGVPLERLALSEDKEFHEMERELRALKKQPAKNKDAVEDLEERMNDRAHELAKEYLAKDRDYLEKEPLGVPVEELPLNEDSAFREMEEKRRALKKDARGSAKAIKELEDRLNGRAEQLAQQRLDKDRAFLDIKPEGILVKDLPLDKDKAFRDMERQLRQLRKDPRKNVNAIRELEEDMNHRAHTLAKRQLADDRNFLNPEPRGVPLVDLALDDDVEFRKTELARREAKKDPKNAAKVRELETVLNEHAERIASEYLKKDRAYLDPEPEGVALEELPLDTDPDFHGMEMDRRKLKKDPGTGSPTAEVRAIEKKMNSRALELAKGVLEGDRGYLSRNPEGVPLEVLPLDTDVVFHAMEVERATAKGGHAVNAKELEALTAQLSERAHEVAKLLLRKDREYLDLLPEGVPLDVLPLDSDAAFRRLEASRLAAKGRSANTLLKHLEDQLNARARELALAQKEEDLRELNQHPHDLPLTLLQPHQDALFGQWIDELRRLKASPGDQRKAIKEVIGRMNERGYAIADSVTKGDRRYLHPKPANVPLSRLPLDADAAFHALEVERAKLKLTDPWKNQHRIADLEDHLNSRAAELAMVVKATDLNSLAPTVRGIPVELLNLHEDPKFEALIAEKEKLPRGCSAEAVAMLLCSMNDCATKAADKLLLGDRGYLDHEVEGVPLAHLPLDTDTDFHEMEVERAVLKARDPVKNCFIVNDLEDQLKKRAHELANAALAMDRGYLITMPEGVPIEELPLNTDSKFHSMEVERARLRVREAEGNVARVQELEGRLNDRAASLARKQLEEDLQGLDREPEGYPLKYLRLHTDAVFAAEVVPLRRAKVDPVGNAMRVREIQATLNARAHALARERILADRARLDQEPNRVPLVLLPLDKDARFVALEKELRMLKAAEKQSSKMIAEAEGRMNDRAHVLAKEFLKQSRGFLDPEPEGVSLAEVPLDDDAEFSARETDRLRLLARGVPLSSSQLRAIEEQLNDRAHQLAAKVKAKGREFLRSKSSDIPKELLALDEDMAFVAKEKELRKLLLHQSDATHLSLAAANLRHELQLRADEVGEAQLRGDREKYLDVQPEGVDLCDIPLDTDHIYHQVEVERAILRRQGATGRDSAVAALEKKLNARAHELAHEIVVGDRDYLPKEMHGIPVEELPLDTDARFKMLERQRRVHKRSPNMRKEVVADEEELRNHALELANEVIALDLEPIKAFYRGIPKEELNLHADSAFRELAKKRRWHRGKGGRVEAKEMTAIEDEMDRRACEIADDVIDKERAFLDPEPEGMYLIEVPLDDDPTFQKLEHEYRRRCKDPLATKQNGDVLRELAEEMNQRSHTLARAAFARIRDFMEPEPEGIPLDELGLDEDPEFKEAEIARYRTNRSSAPDAAMVAEMELRMEKRARELARATLAADRAFLDPKPEGVPLEVLPLDTEKEFGDLARERRRRKKTLKGGIGDAEVRALEEKMNARSHEMAKEFLQAERAFLSREPEGVPLDDLPLNSDPLFRAMEDKRLQWKRDLHANATMRAAKEAELEERAHVIAKELLRKERAFLDPEPLGVPLEELPLNYDSVLNPVERKRRALRMHSKRNHEAIRACEEQMVDRVLQIAAAFVEKERGFLDQNPEGVPLRYLPLNTDREFHEKELHRRKLLQRCERNRGEIADTERKMNERVHALAKDLVLKGRAFLHAEPCGVPIADVPLNEDEQFRKMEEKRRALKEAGRSAASVKAIEEKLNDRAEVLAQRLLDEERAFMDGAPLGIPLHDLPLNTDRRMREIERTRRQLRKSDPGGGAADIEVLEAGMNARAYELADQLLRNDRGYLHPEPRGVPLADLPLHTDRIFHKMELERFRAKKDGQANLAPMENELNERAMELAAEFIRIERSYLDQTVEGVALERLQLDTDPTFHKLEQERRRLKRSGENPPLMLELEHLLNLRAHELAMELRGWQDPEFHARNEHVAEQWVRVCELYPEGRYEPFEPAAPAPGDVVSAPRDVGFLAPFIAALSRHPVLLQRLIATKETPVNAPYTFVFFDPHSNPVYVDVDDRVPCTQEREPKFLQSSYHQWYPLLLEKAYAKFIGGYERLVNCTSLETLRDLTGRPVTHTPFDLELAEAANLGRYASVDFWLRVAEDMARGDVALCSSNAKVPDGIHPLCSYALVGVVVTLEGSTNPSDVVIKLENSYRNDEPVYHGPLCHTDVNWSQALQRVCQYDHWRDDVLYLPLPTFLRNFSSMQTCRINCGDRLTATGAWDSRTSGGSAKFTSFRNNPVFVLQNSSSRPATVISELRHASPLFVDPDGANHYLPSGVVLMEPTSASAPLTPLITNSTARILQRGIMLDSREVCSTMEIPANSTCLLIPYTAKVGQHGSFFLSVYPGCSKISLAPLHYCGLSREPKSTAVTLIPGAEGQRVDFTVSSACDVHVLLRQEKMNDLLAAVEGDAVADDAVLMVAFSDQAMKLTSSGEATNAREHSLVFRAEKPGYYSLLLTSPNQPVSGDNPCTVSIFTPKRVLVKFVPPPAGARPLQPTRLPTLPQRFTKNTCTTNPRRLPVSIAARQSQQRQRKDSLPPLRSKDAGTLSPGPVSHSVMFSCSF